MGKSPANQRINPATDLLFVDYPSYGPSHTNYNYLLYNPIYGLCIIPFITSYN